MTLTKADIASVVAKTSGLSHVDSKQIVDGFFEEIRHNLEQGREVKLSGFGNFVLNDKPARPGRNPRTGKPVMVTARRVATFNAGAKLRSAVA